MSDGGSAGTGPVDTDVLVLGGGPAGCAAALTAAERGLRVTLLEAEHLPRDRPGETLHPGVEPLLRELGVADAVAAAGFERHEGHWVAWGGPPRFAAFGADGSGPWRGLQARRAEFDALLVGRASAVGVQVHTGRRARAVVLDGGRVAGVLTEDGAVRASTVVDATGAGGFLARRLGLGPVRYSPPLVARYGYREGRCTVRDQAPSLVADPDGWTWTARTGPGLYAWTRLWRPGTRVPHDWLPAEFRALRRRGRDRGADVGWRSVARAAGPGWYVVGDAAAVLDPASSHGVLRALMSGMLAAHAIGRTAAGELSVDRAQAGYRSWLEDWVAHDLRALRDLYARLRWPVWPPRHSTRRRSPP